MLLPDVNVLLAAFRPDHVHHAPAAAFLADARGGSAVLGLADVALASLIRLATNPRVFRRPDPTWAVLDFVDVLLGAPGQLTVGSPAIWTRFAGLCRDLGLRGNAVPDALLAAVALEHRAELVTFDRGFGVYGGLRWRCLAG